MSNFSNVNPVVAELILTAAHVDNNHVRASLIESNGIDIEDADLNAFLIENGITITEQSTDDQDDIDNELRLVLDFKHGSHEAYQALALKYQGIIGNMARNYTDSKEDFEDACIEMQFVLKNALQKYDPTEHAVSFRYYAVRSFTNGLLEFKRTNNAIVLPENLVRECNKVLKAASKLNIYFNDKKQITERNISRIAEATGIKLDRLYEVLNYLPMLNNGAATASMDNTTETSEGSTDFAAVLTCESSQYTSAEELLVHEDVMKNIHEAIEAATEDDYEGYEIICEFYGLNGYEKKKRKDIAAERNMTVYQLDLIRTDVEDKIGLELINRGFSYDFNENIDTFLKQPA